jgi:hypothetical protein
VLVSMVLVKASHLEVSKTFSKSAFSEALINAMTVLPENIYRLYVATHRFRLTSAVITEVQRKYYSSWDSTDIEDPAFYQNDVLLLGAISHEDLVVMLLSEDDRNALNTCGFAFCEE